MRNPTLDPTALEAAAHALAEHDGVGMVTLAGYFRARYERRAAAAINAYLAATPAVGNADPLSQFEGRSDGTNFTTVEEGQEALLDAKGEG